MSVKYSEDEIYQRMRKALIDVFEIPDERISMDAHLSDDLDIDSIDAVDLIAELRELLPRKVDPEEFKRVTTVRDVVVLLHELGNR